MYKSIAAVLLLWLLYISWFSDKRTKIKHETSVELSTLWKIKGYIMITSPSLFKTEPLPVVNWLMLMKRKSNVAQQSLWFRVRWILFLKLLWSNRLTVIFPTCWYFSISPCRRFLVWGFKLSLWMSHMGSASNCELFIAFLVKVC